MFVYSVPYKDPLERLERFIEAHNHCKEGKPRVVPDRKDAKDAVFVSVMETSTCRLTPDASKKKK